MTTAEESAALTSHQPEELVAAVLRAEQDFRDVRDVSRALDERGAEARERSGRAIVALHQQGKSWSELSRLTGLSRTTLLRRAQPYMEEKQQHGGD